MSPRFVRASALALLALAAGVAPGCAQSSARLDDLMGGADAHDLLRHPEKATTREAYRIDGMAGWSKTSALPA